MRHKVTVIYEQQLELPCLDTTFYVRVVGWNPTVEMTILLDFGAGPLSESTLVYLNGPSYVLDLFYWIV